MPFVRATTNLEPEFEKTFARLLGVWALRALREIFPPFVPHDQSLSRIKYNIIVLSPLNILNERKKLPKLYLQSIVQN